MAKKTEKTEDPIYNIFNDEVYAVKEEKDEISFTIEEEVFWSESPIKKQQLTEFKEHERAFVEAFLDDVKESSQNDSEPFKGKDIKFKMDNGVTNYSMLFSPSEAHDEEGDPMGGFQYSLMVEESDMWDITDELTEVAKMLKEIY